jgi:hypothetical protein
MKKYSISALVAILILVMLVGSAFAATQDLPGSGWWSGEQIQNVGADVAQIDITAYGATAADVFTVNDSINKGSSKTYIPTNFPNMPAGFQGSAVVSSNSDIRAIVNVTNRFVSNLSLGDPNTASYASGEYQGTNQPDTSINFPLVKNDHFGKTTTFFIQNAGSAAATATAVFVFPSGTYTYSVPSIDPGHMAVVSPSLAKNSGGQAPPSGNGVVGSLTVKSAQPVAGTVLEHETSAPHPVVLQATRAFSAADYDTTLFAPINKNSYYGRFTGLQVQNVSSGPVDVDVSYVAKAESATSGNPTGCAGGTASDHASAVPAGASHTFASNVLPAGCFGAATITASDNVVAIVNEEFTSAFLNANPSRAPEDTAYQAAPLKGATQVISLPLYKENAYSNGTGISVQNVSNTQATNVILTFKSPAGTFTSKPQTINPGAAIIVLDERKNANFWNGTAMTEAGLGCQANTTGCGQNGTMGVIVASDQPVVAIANEATYPFTNPLIHGDEGNYEGFNLAAAP